MGDEIEKEMEYNFTSLKHISSSSDSDQNLLHFVTVFKFSDISLSFIVPETIAHTNFTLNCPLTARPNLETIHYDALTKVYKTDVLRLTN